jgi:hypothetical protein
LVLLPGRNQTYDIESLSIRTAQAFTDDEMKDMLVDMHSPAYHHLMARANYDIDAHSYLEITQYLQNLGLIEESFNKGNAQNKQHGNASPKLIRPIRTTRSTVEPLQEASEW